MFGLNTIHGRSTFEKTGEKKLLVTSSFLTLQGEGPYQGRPALFIRLTYCSLACSFSFGWFPTTGRHPEVTMAEGNKKKMSEVEEGDTLLTLDESGHLVETTVVSIINREVDQWVKVTIEGTLYYMTPEHPIFTNRGLVQAKDLNVGDEILHTAKKDILSYKKKKNNPMFNQSSVEKRVKNTDYTAIGNKISKTIADKKVKGTYEHPFALMDNESYKELCKKIAARQTGLTNSHYNQNRKDRNFDNIKKEVKAGKHTCFLCDKSQIASDSSLEVHHMDGNHDNDAAMNLVVLCKSCHTSMHEKWKSFPWYKEKELAAHNGMRVEKVVYVDRMSRFPSLRGRRLPITSLTCAPHPTYIADNMWNHNCDTFFDEGSWFTNHELLTQSLRIIRSKFSDTRKCGIVITGGEPTLQTNIAEFLLSCEVAGVAFTQIESNGILYVERLPAKTTLVISPKCSEKTYKYLTPHEKVLNAASCLKFVVSSDPESPYHTIPDWAFEWQQETGRDIYISPMNMYRTVFLEMARARFLERKEHGFDYRSTVDEVISGWDDTILDREQNMHNHQYAAQYALNNGLFLTLQMHLYASIA